METAEIEITGAVIRVEYNYFPPYRSLDYDVPDDDEEFEVTSVVIEWTTTNEDVDTEELNEALKRDNILTEIQEQHGT